MSYALGQTYTDPWTRSASESYELAKRRGLGTESVSLDPPPIKPIPWAMVAGWGAVVLVTAGIFWATTQGGSSPARPVRANSRARCKKHDWDTEISRTVIYTKSGEPRSVSKVRCTKCGHTAYRGQSKSTGKTYYYSR